ncbi:MAG: hypothetical protein BWY85_01451 [Firmicutes bacterium ADurb.Bin506]|nr:MAG: hypothetical protein BWY85_01451 [Firmicutes bacterium ADurb.Bin506]
MQTSPTDTLALLEARGQTLSTISSRPSRAKSGFRRKIFPMTFDSYLVKTPDGYGLKAPWCCFLGFLSAMPTPPLLYRGYVRHETCPYLLRMF